MSDGFIRGLDQSSFFTFQGVNQGDQLKPAQDLLSVYSAWTSDAISWAYLDGKV